jgi:hypothetical protein
MHISGDRREPERRGGRTALARPVEGDKPDAALGRELLSKTKVQPGTRGPVEVHHHGAIGFTRLTDPQYPPPAADLHLAHLMTLAIAPPLRDSRLHHGDRSQHRVRTLATPGAGRWGGSHGGAAAIDPPARTHSFAAVPAHAGAPVRAGSAIFRSQWFPALRFAWAGRNCGASRGLAGGPFACARPEGNLDDALHVPGLLHTAKSMAA